MEKIGIVGIGFTKIEAEKPTQNYPEMVYEAVKAAIEVCGADIEDIDNILSNER